MRKRLTHLAIYAALSLSTLAITPAALADEVKVGPVTKITLAADGKSAIAIIKDNKSGESVNITITDELTLDKLKDKRIVEGDDIRAKYDDSSGKNESKSFKKTAGC